MQSVQAQLKHPRTTVSTLKDAPQISYSWLTPKRCSSVLLCAVAFQKDTMKPGSKNQQGGLLQCVFFGASVGVKRA